MQLSDIPPGSVVFIDANVPLALILQEASAPEAKAFLQRVEDREVQGVTSVIVIGEIFHRSLIAETCRLLGVHPSDALRRLKAEPALFQKLHECWELIDDFLELPLTVYSLDESILVHALRLSKEHSLLHNDATHLALMLHHVIPIMASFDGDWQRVDCIQLYGR